VASLVEKLNGLAQSALNNAAEQERASAGSDAGALNSTHSANPDGYGLNGGTYGRDRDMMDLARACGDHSTGADHDAMVPNGWHELSTDELKELGIDPKSLQSELGDGFSATLYRDASGNFVLAYAGTNFDQAGDLVSDAMGASVGVSFQQAHAVDLALAVKSQLNAHGGLGNSLEFTGHSLGGELASVASVATGNRAVTFNAAGLSLQAIEAASAVRLATGGGVATPWGAEGQVTAYSSDNDPLSTVQDATPLPDAFGNRVILHSGNGGIDHDFASLKSGFEKMVTSKGGGH
jgi:hypothetical protein